MDSKYTKCPTHHYLRSLLCPNNFPQVSQLNSFIPSWTVLTWTLKFLLFLKLLPQASHWWFLRFSWTASIWAFKLPDWRNDLLQISQWFPVMPSWITCMWRLSSYLSLYATPQNSQLKSFIFSWTRFTCL